MCVIHEYTIYTYIIINELFVDIQILLIKRYKLN